jgi:hypothetical protein
MIDENPYVAPQETPIAARSMPRWLVRTLFAASAVPVLIGLFVLWFWARMRAAGMEWHDL